MAAVESRPPAPEVKTVACPSCGASLALRAPGRSLSLACSGCGAILDARHPDFPVIQRYRLLDEKMFKPQIPLGTRGKFKGETYEVVGYLVRRASAADGTAYSWAEYVLFNPYLGFRWLSEYEGHWVLSKAAAGRPIGKGAEVSYLGGSFRHFQTAEAEARVVLGEFPWRVKVGEKAKVEDYVDPPRLLSRETREDEITWSIGDHIDGGEVWKALNLPGPAPVARGVGAAQPSPLRPQVRSVWALLLAFVVAAVLIQVVFGVLSQHKRVFEKTFVYEKGKGSAAFTTEAFELTGRQSNVMVEIQTNLANRWAYFTLALVNDSTGATRNFGRELGYYSGSDSDGSWSEGANRDTVFLPGVAAGRYYLLVDPESDSPQLVYTIAVTRDVPRTLYFFLALVVLAVPPLLFLYRVWRFEYRRWQESDHPMLQSSSGED